MPKPKTVQTKLSEEDYRDLVVAIHHYVPSWNISAFVTLCSQLLIKHHKSGDSLLMPLDFVVGKESREHPGERD
jgi:hypothetical protein